MIFRKNNRLQDFFRVSKKVLKKQITRSGRLPSGGSVKANQMLERAIAADFLSPQVRREHIEIWCNVLYLHTIAAREEYEKKQGVGSFPKTITELQSEWGNMLKVSLKKADLKIGHIQPVSKTMQINKILGRSGPSTKDVKASF